MRELWIWFSASLALVRAQPPPDKDNPHILHLPSSLINDTARENIFKDCDDPLVHSVDSDPVAAWRGLGCFELHGILDYDWYINQSHTKLSYVEYISHKMGGPSNWRCREIDNIPCSSPDVQCRQTEFACGHLILNSLANVHAMYARGYNGLLSAHDRFQDDLLSFTDVFAPELTVIDWLGDLLIPMITLGLGLLGEATERSLKTIAKNLKAIKKAERESKGKGSAVDEDKLDKELDEKYKHINDKIKDGIMLAAGMAQPYSRLYLPEELTGETTNAKVSSLLGHVYDQLTRMQMMQVNHLFNGSSHSMSALWRIIDDGTFALFDGNNTLFDYHEEAKKMFIAALIPQAWKVAPGFEEDREGLERKLVSSPTFLKTGSKCGEKPSQLDVYPHDGDFVEICHNDEQWYIIRLEATFGGTRGSLEQPRWWFKLRTLPGTDVLASENGFRGVKGTDLLISALSAYEQSSQKQFWSPSEEASLIKEDGSGYAFRFTDGLHTPGLVQMQVCTDWDKMQKVLRRYTNFNQMEEIDNPEWPCGFIED